MQYICVLLMYLVDSRSLHKSVLFTAIAIFNLFDYSLAKLLAESTFAGEL